VSLDLIIQLDPQLEQSLRDSLIEVLSEKSDVWVGLDDFEDGTG
jgi:hypothetical protein